MTSWLLWLRRPLPFRYFYATLGILAVNLLVFVLTQADHSSLLLSFLALTPAGFLEHGLWWQLLTYYYTHANMNHILFNMLGLVFVGLSVEERIGSWEFSLFYHLMGILCGIASLFFFLLMGQSYIYLLGSSGAVFSVMLAFAGFYPNRRLLIFFIIPIKAIYLILIFAALEVFSQLLNPYSGTAHLTHLSGFFFAFLYLLVRFGINPWRAFWNRDPF